MICISSGGGGVSVGIGGGESIFAFTFLSPPFKLSSPTLDNLDTFLRVCNPNDGLQVQLMIEAGFDGFASLIGGICSQQGHISMMISPLRFDPVFHDEILLSHLHGGYKQ
ncbi:unnamed protein product [Schistocephalus solidus]|uniref:PEROXIDASE_4 domain-containing protein n=1 Tax=Schistocephalus solidus TaxID=70667 RepID=A0A183S9T2_SCHSO|nr:unnamed protein product [Schistocephalus solidus]